MIRATDLQLPRRRPGRNQYRIRSKEVFACQLDPMAMDIDLVNSRSEPKVDIELGVSVGVHDRGRAATSAAREQLRQRRPFIGDDGIGIDQRDRIVDPEIP